MDCKFLSTIICSEGQDCSKCGWNPVVAKERIKKGKKSVQANLVHSLRSYKKKAADDAIRVLATQVGGTVTSDVLECICEGGSPQLEPGEVRRIDQVLRRIEGLGNG